MFEIRVDRLAVIAAILAVFTGGIHLAFGGYGLYQWIHGDPPSILPLFFTITGVVILLGVLDAKAGRVPRDRLYTLGALLMCLHLLAYLDWHVLSISERLVGLGTYGHEHAHGEASRDIGEILATVEENPWGIGDGLASLSVVLATLLHAMASPIALLTKATELLLLMALLILRWADNAGSQRLCWHLRPIHVRWGLLTAGTGAILWIIVILFGGDAIRLGADPLFLDLLELSVFAGLLLSLGIWFVARPLQSQSSDTNARSVFDYIPGLPASRTISTIGILSVYGIVFVILLAAVAGFVPAENNQTHDHHSSPALEELIASMEAEGIDVDEEWTMVHYSGYHGGDALMLDYFTDHQGDRPGVEEEIEIILNTYIDAREAGDFADVVVVLGETRTPDDTSYVWWEIDQDWIAAYLNNTLAYDELLDRVLDTYDKQ